MSNFRVGQKLVCIKRDPWRFRSSGRVADGPAYGDVVTVLGPGSEQGYVALVEWRHTPTSNSFRASAFRPVSEPDLTAELAASEVQRLVVERPEHINEPALS